MISFALLFFIQSVTAQEAPSSPLWDALQKNDVAKVVSLIEEGAPVDLETYLDTPLTYAIKLDSTEIITALLEHGANPNRVQPVSHFTPLMVAAKHKNLEAVELLLNHGANVNLSGVFGRNPLHIAALHNAVEIAHVLLTKTDVQTNTRGILCPLAVASRQGYQDFVTVLLREAKTPPTAKCLQSAKDMAIHNKHDAVSVILNQVKI